MSKTIFEYNLNLIRTLRNMKDQNLSVVIDSRFPHVNGKHLVLTKEGFLSTQLELADTSISASDTLIKNNEHYSLVRLYDSVIEDRVVELMNLNAEYMDHMTYSEEEWAHVE